MTIPANGNTLGAVVWTRNSIGHYIGTLAGAFTSKIVVCSLVQSSFALPSPCFLQIARFNNDTVVIRTFDSSGVLADGILNNASLKIEVFSI